MLSEEEIIKNIKEQIQWSDHNTYKMALQDLLDLYNKEKEKNKKAVEMLQEHIKFCEQEARGSLNNEICHIALKFDKHLLQELLEERN